jgi:iron complex outermembrane recepter protein
MMVSRFVHVVLCVTFYLFNSAHAFGSENYVSDFTELSIEQLMHIEVTSVGKKTQNLSDAAAAVYVITSEDLRRSGVTSIPEALRMVPGLQVARIDANKWAITARGFNGRFANKLLVLMDGRSLYTPLFSGVCWDVQDPMLEDVERIEVIRGPGATLWGANAVNGVINIITKKAEQTQGGLLTAGGGSEERGFGSVRFGSQIGDRTFYRVYGKYFDRTEFVDHSGDDMADDWNSLHVGFRLDSALSRVDSLTLQGDIYSGRAGQTDFIPTRFHPDGQVYEQDSEFSGGNLLGRWERIFSADSDLALQFYYDRTNRDDEGILQENLDIFDLDFQHRFAPLKNHEVIWGLGYRLTHDDIHGHFENTMGSDSEDNRLFSAFIQDEITLVPNDLSLIIGSKFENNEYTGFEYQPNIRLVWKVDLHHTFWGAVSRAVRTPSRIEDDGHFIIDIFSVGDRKNPFAPDSPAVVTVDGNRDFDSESLIAYELGYRFVPSDRFYIDLAVFINQYDNYRTGEPCNETSPYIRNDSDNNAEAGAHGVELLIDWKPLDWWELETAYSYFELDIDMDRASNDQTTVLVYEEAGPKHQLSLRSSMELSPSVEFDLRLRYVDDIHINSHRVDAYLVVDARLAWKVTKNLELALVLQNLMDDRHPEFIPEYRTLPSEVPGGGYVKLMWRF